MSEEQKAVSDADKGETGQVTASQEALKEEPQQSTAAEDGRSEGTADDTKQPEVPDASKQEVTSDEQKADSTAEEISTGVKPEELKEHESSPKPQEQADQLPESEKSSGFIVEEPSQTISPEPEQHEDTADKEAERLEDSISKQDQQEDAEIVEKIEASNQEATPSVSEAANVAVEEKKDENDAVKSGESVAPVTETSPDSPEVYHEAIEEKTELVKVENDDRGEERVAPAENEERQILASEQSAKDDQEDLENGREPEDWVAGGTGDNWVDSDQNGNGTQEQHENGDEVEKNKEAAEGEEEELDDDEIADNPAYIPKSPRYYMHDSRTVEEGVPVGRGERTSRADCKWKHDKFDENSQAPKSKRELVVRYGFDIRNEDKPSPPAANRGQAPRSERQQKEEPLARETHTRSENVRESPRGGRGGRGMPGRPQQQYNERQNDRPNREPPQGTRNGVGYQQKTLTFTNPRGRGASNRGAVPGRGGSRPQPHEFERLGAEGRFKGPHESPKDYPPLSKRTEDYPPPRRGRGGYTNAGRGGATGASGDAGAGGGGGKRYSKQRTAVAYAEGQQRTAPAPQTTVQEAAPPPPPVTTVPAQPARNPDWQRPPPPTFQPQQLRPLPPQQIRPMPPLQPAVVVPIPTAATAAFRAPNDTVYFDPTQQMVRGAAPPQPRAKKRLEIVPPAN